MGFTEEGGSLSIGPEDGKTIEWKRLTKPVELPDFRMETKMAGLLILVARCNARAEIKSRFCKPQLGCLIKTTQPFKSLSVGPKGSLPLTSCNRYFLTITDKCLCFPWEFACPDMHFSTAIGCLSQYSAWRRTRKQIGTVRVQKKRECSSHPCDSLQSYIINM